ncbi:hypothetical protein [Methylobacter tundripaludum]
MAVWQCVFFCFLTLVRCYLNELFFGVGGGVVRRIAWLLGLFITADKSDFYSIIYGFKRFVWDAKNRLSVKIATPRANAKGAIQQDKNQQ